MVDITETTSGLYIENMESPVDIHQVMVSLRSALEERGIEMGMTSDMKDGIPTAIFIKLRRVK